MMHSNRRIFGLLGSTAMALALAPSLASAQAPAASAATAPGTPGATQTQVVFQVSDGDAAKWNLTLNNMHNLQVDLGHELADLELVVYGPGIGMLKIDSPVATRIADMLKSGVKIVACENTMKGMKLVHADMLADIGYVASGVVELVRKQQQGHIYIRP